MLKRADWSDRIAILGIVLGALAVYLPWYAYSVTTTQVSVNGFRASVMGDLFFLAIAAAALLVLMRHGVIADILGGRVSDRGARLAVAAVAGGAVFVQLLLILMGGRSASGGILCAVAAVAALCAAGLLCRVDVEPRRTVREMLGEGLPDQRL